MPSKFFCGRKMIYGLNMMGVCDSRRRFTWIEVNIPGAASDFFAFDQSSIKKKLETEQVTVSLATMLMSIHHTCTRLGEMSAPDLKLE